MQERLGKRADDDRLAHLAAPGAEVPPLDVAGVQPVLGGAAVGLDAVHEVEPVALLRERALDALDRLDEPAAVARLDVGHRSSACIAVSPAGTVCDEEHRRAAVAA